MSKLRELEGKEQHTASLAAVARHKEKVLSWREAASKALEKSRIRVGSIEHWLEMALIEYDKAKRELAEVKAERDALKEDAERYRLFKKIMYRPMDRMRPEIRIISICHEFGDEKEIRDLDKLIDASSK